MTNAIGRYLYKQDTKEYHYFKQTLEKLRQASAATAKPADVTTDSYSYNMPVSSGKRRSPSPASGGKRGRRSDDSDGDGSYDRILTDSPPLPCINNMSQVPPPSWDNADAAGTSAAPSSVVDSGYQRVTADQASRPGSLMSGMAAPNPSNVDMSSVPPPVDLDRGAEGDTEDAGLC